MDRYFFAGEQALLLGGGEPPLLPAVDPVLFWVIVIRIFPGTALAASSFFEPPSKASTVFFTRSLLTSIEASMSFVFRSRASFTPIFPL
ncbi:hypothetical protein AWB67_07252 [Caballeronia terrestris]|uniref:Uncharacterized protein n=1 Tax=Caballeronia terrestris TaxID=1226301 RepID=A0A158KZU2_9BURK|nr:hypothetical protein AWB67_07252 [Caballeronia terrestris]